MKNTFSLLAATAAVSLATSAFAASESAEVKSKMEHKKNGGYESTRTSDQTTDGTRVSGESKVDVDVNSDGTVDKTVKNETVKDPKGMWNKKKDATKTEYEEKANGGYKQTTTSKHTDAEGTNITLVTTTDVDVDNAGNITSVAKTEKNVDPKGLMNQETTTDKTKTVNGKVIERTKKVN